ncbi:unnamed protein product [Sphagnum troendelagicum]|uniref:Uncharacterized protein n=1 Tax=Sphagnum troendelagicum TaxID=128251 RepID=A0ABP0ULF8_9BRYO
MGFSAPKSCTLPWRYDVFLNHRGPDVKDTFVAHLNDALCAAGFHPFLDAKSLIKGKHPYNSINEALSGVGVHVAIFSKGYAESKYCLDELHDMLESGKLILPVFYGVEVEHLRRPYDGPFAAGLRKHKKRGRHQDVERWETALAKVADLQGFRLAEFNGDEAQLKRRIVLAVQRALPARRLQQVAPHRVGLEESLKVVIKKLNLTGDSVGIIGVFGMGGIGKTTLVREVYNHFAMEKRFEEHSFLKDVRSITDPLDLQKQLVYDLLQEDLQSSEKFSYWFDRFMGRKVLIVVDDIDHRSQFDVLIPHIDKLARGSRILVTSRDQNVLTNIMRGDGHLTAMHEVELMSPHDSYRLFNWHAFYNEKASDGFQDLARKVADACCRLPLALEVIGAFLFDKKRPEDRDCWHQATETLRANGDILNKLKISYDGLSSDESRLMFTDIACFLIGKDEQMAMQIFESCISYTGPQVSFHALMDKSLVTLDSDRRIRMHDLLRDMGRNVVTKQSQIEGQRSHLWDPAIAERVLRKNQGTDTVRGLSVAGAKDGAAWKAETYTRMSELHFLILDHCQVKGDFSTWSKELRWLQWWSLPLSELPPTLSLLNLSVLDLTGSKSVTRISPKNSNDEFPCKELRMLVLKDCTTLEELPQTIGKLSRLKNLDVQGCSTLKALPNSFPCKELRMLILKDCTTLEELPQTIGKLSRLKNLDVQGCSTLKALPDSVGELVELTQLNLSNCTTLERLPDTICHLSKLKKLWLINCTELEFLPTEFGKLQRLDEFWADATSLSRLPDSFSQLSNLEDLHLHKCENIQELPSMSGLFPCKELRMLILKDCTTLEELPQTIGKLSRLNNLDVQGCSTLKALPNSVGELVELTQLNLSNCTTLKRLPNTICRLSKLQKLWLNNCTKLKFLPIEFGKLQRLDEFWADATSLSRLPDSFSQLSNLEDLHLSKCEEIQELPSMSGLFPCKELRMLILKDCTTLEELPQTIGKLSRLKNLDVQGCSTLKALPNSVGELVELTQLNLSNCTTLKRLPDTVCRLSKLQKLWLNNCTKLKFLPIEFGKLQRLDEFWADATSLSRLPDSFSQLSNLADLHLSKCEKIQELPSMSGLFPCKELRMLILKDCTTLEELPQTIGKLSRLKNLDVQGCSTLKALPDSVGELVELTQLNLSNCTTLERLPDTICHLSKLKKLWLINCTELEFLPIEFGKLQRLDEFWADATSLSRLPDSFSQLSNLEDLHLHKCEEIEELPSMSGLVKLKLFHMGHIGVRTLPEDFGHLQNLVDLHLYGCKNLETLPQSFGLLQLQRLEMYDNPELKMPLEGFGRPKKRKHDSLFIKLKVIRTVEPSTFLELGTKSLKNVENTISAQSSNSVLINQLQCDYLVHKLRESLNDAKACIDGLSPQDIQPPCCILESLAQTWKEGEILVVDCCDAQWIRVAMILANAKEHFTSLIFKLRLYMQLFQSIFKEGATKEFLIKLQDRKWSDDVKDEEFPIIDEKALEDQQWLLSRLMKVGSSDSENLIKRLNHPGKIDAWKVEHKSIQRVVPHGQIGKGGSAIVHKVEWLGKHFAEKCFFGPEGEHFQKEASLLAGLSHPNILPLFCLVTTANSCSLVTELMDGDLLGLMHKRLYNHEMQGAPFKLLEAIDIMLQVAEGMHYLHQKKVVHRDLKSTNILVKCDEHDGHVYAKVADFGLSKTKESSCTYSNLTMDQGTTRWMAPELFGNFDQSVPIQVCQETQHPSLSNEQISRRYPFKVDIYSFGMVCYEILTGNFPFHNINSMTELRTKVKDGLRPDLPEQCPHQLSKLIQECYHPDPATRPSFFKICLELRHIMCSLMIGCTL